MIEEDVDLIIQPTLQMAVHNTPISWWVPQEERTVLAICSTAFWGFTILQAIQKEPHGASVIAFFGLGLMYTACVLANTLGGLKHALAEYDEGHTSFYQARALAQLFSILASMLLCNAIVLSIYLAKGTTLTRLDTISIAAAAFITTLLIRHYGFRQLFTNPFSRGWVAIACKALPQCFLAILFATRPITAQAFTELSLGGLVIIASLRFWPSIKAYRRDPASPHLRGLLLSECGNMLSLVFMVAAWTWARLVVPG